MQLLVGVCCRSGLDERTTEFVLTWSSGTGGGEDFGPRHSTTSPLVSTPAAWTTCSACWFRAHTMMRHILRMAWSPTACSGEQEYAPCTRVCLRETNAPRAPRIAPRMHRALVFGSPFTYFWQIFRVAGMRWLRGQHTTTEASTLPPHQYHGGCSCPHPLPGGGGGGGVEHKETSSAGPAPKRVPHRVPKPVEHSFRHVSQFEPHGVLIPVRCPSVGVLLLVLLTLLLSRRIAQE